MRVLLLLLLSLPAQAQYYERAFDFLPEWLYLDVSFNAGYGGISLPDLKGDTPKMGQFGASVTTGFFISEEIFIGVSAGHRTVRQYSTYNSAVGNYLGNRFNFASPTAGYFSEDFIIKGDIQFLGMYDLEQETFLNGRTKFSKPFGVRIIGLMPVFEGIWGGIQAEHTSYNEVNDNELEDSLSVWQFGLVATYVL